MSPEISEQLLQQRFGLPSFRRGQREILSSVLKGQDVLAVLPTGGGKSLCYQYPALLKNQLVIVISPLIALMRDQVSSLRRQGIAAGCLHSGQSEAEKREIFAEIEKQSGYILYLSPERAQKEGFRRWIKNRKIALFAIDEAHCVSQWGHDFREEYSQLNILKELRPDVPVLSLTASATPLVLRDISKQLGLVSPAKHVHGFYRPNLYYQVEICTDEDSKMEYLEQALQQFPEGRVIVYCGTRRQTEEVSARLSRRFQGVGFYHAGLSPDQRSDTQEAYENGELRILIATNAFGMGIDHPDVRLVVHFQMPANIDSLYQEMGRAGRDGKPSTCLMLYARRDKGLQSFFIQESEAPVLIKKARWNTLDALVAYAEGSECRHAEILTYYQDAQRIERCGHCDVCDPNSERRVKKPTPKFISFPKPGKARSKKSSLMENLSPDQEEVFENLKQWRRDKAKELDVPAFVIFSDRTLRDLAIQMPTNVEEMRSAYGVGEAKLERFASEVLQVIAYGHFSDH